MSSSDLTIFIDALIVAAVTLIYLLGGLSGRATPSRLEEARLREKRIAPPAGRLARPATRAYLNVPRLVSDTGDLRSLDAHASH